MDTVRQQPVKFYSGLNVRTNPFFNYFKSEYNFLHVQKEVGAHLYDRQRSHFRCVIKKMYNPNKHFNGLKI